MNLKITTTDLQNMVSKASQCVSNNKLIPMTSLINIQCIGGELMLVTTDYTNYFYTKSPSKVECDSDCIVSVLADTFVKLVQKTTSETISLSVEGNILTVKGNGTYKLELPLDENGNPIKFPEKLSDTEDLIGTIKISDVKSIIDVNKSALAVDMQEPVLTNYYCADKVITSNKKVICKNPLSVFSKPILISSKLMDLLSIVSGTSVSVFNLSDAALVFKTDTDTIYSPVVEGVETFPVNAMETLISSQFPSVMKLPRKPILDVLDRLALFVGSYDKKGIHMTFTREGLMLSSKKSSGSELIPCEHNPLIAPSTFSCSINIEFFQNQLNSVDSDFIELYYGSELAIKIEAGDIIKVVALLNETNTKE